MEKEVDLPEEVDSIALKFLDLRGKSREIRIPPDMLDIVLEDGISFDSSNVGFTDISESDMVAIPDPDVYKVIDYEGEKVAIFLCEMYWPDGSYFKGDPRYMLSRTLEELEEEGITVSVKPEYEFHLLDEESCTPIDSGRYIDGRSAYTNMLGKLTRVMRDHGVKIEKIHHEVGRGQYEIEPLPYEGPIEAADDFMFIKEVVKKRARENGMLTTFMPKPVVGDAGNGLHVHMSLKKDGEYLFSPAELNEEAEGFIGGLLDHAKALSAVCSPTINSYKRLVPGFEAPVYISWGGENRSVLVRIPAYGNSEEPRGRIEFRGSDASANIYLLLNSIIRAGMDGLDKGLNPGDEVVDDLYELDEEEIADRGIDVLPNNLNAALDHLEQDKVVADALGESYPHYLDLKRAEILEFGRDVTDWEMNRYLEY